MQAAPVPIVPWLPGTSASKAAKGFAIVFGAFVFVLIVPLTVLGASTSGARGGHLPWPVVQWAVTTPLGVLILQAVCLLVICPPIVLFSVRQRRQEVARAIDVTGVPPWAWPGPHPWRLSLHDWLGRARREQVVSLILLVLGLLLAGGLLGTFVASGIYGFAANGAVQCDANGNGCPPNFLPAGAPAFGFWAAIPLAFAARSRRLRRVEAACHVWLRYRDWVSMAPLCYIRQPGVTPEAAAAGLAQFSTSLAVPAARRFFLGVLVFTPYMMVTSASLVLSAWLRLAWVPG